MIRLDIQEANTHLSEYLAKLKQGEVLILCKRNTPVAEITPLPAARRKRRPVARSTVHSRIK